MGAQDTPVGIVPFDHESVTVTASSIGLTTGTFLDASEAFLTIEDAPLRMTLDGTSASATVGHLVGQGGIITLKGTAEIVNFRGYRTTGVSAVVKATYYH